MAMRPVLLACCLLGAVCAHAADIYMWVDERGRVQFADVVPERYKASARRIDSRSFELTPQQQAEAQARAAEEKRRAAQLESDSAAARQPPAQMAPPTAGAIQPPATDCAALQRAYVQSQECFAPFVMKNGAVREQAFKACVAVPDPSAKCGIQPLQ